MKRKSTNTLGKLQQQKKLSVVMLMQLQLLELELLSKRKNNADIAEKYSDTKGREVFVPLQDIHTDTKRFQNRDEEYSAESVNRLINAVQINRKQDILKADKSQSVLFGIGKPKRVGKISKSLAQKAHIVPANIYLERGNQNYGEVHIEIKHQKELAQLGITAYDFVKSVCEDLNAIYKGIGTDLILVKNSTSKSDKTAVVQLKNKRKSNYYTVITAFPMKKKTIQKKQKLWEHRTE